MPKYANIIERIAANSVVGDEITFANQPCWLYGGKVDCRGYGLVTERVKSGKRKGKVVNKRVHRESHRILNNKRVGKKYVVRHGCNVRCCWNPAHTLGGSLKSNVADCLKAQRHWSGFKGPKPGDKEDLIQIRIQQRVKKLFSSPKTAFRPDISFIEDDIV